MTEEFMPIHMHILTFIISYLQLNIFLDTNALEKSALETVDGNIEWLNKYGADISAWLTKYGPSVTTDGSTVSTDGSSVSTDGPGGSTDGPGGSTGGPGVTSDGTGATTAGESKTTAGSGNIATNTIVITIAFITALLHGTQFFN
jgi:hypothetical protein